MMKPVNEFLAMLDPRTGVEARRGEVGQLLHSVNTISTISTKRADTLIVDQMGQHAFHRHARIARAVSSV